MSTVDRNLQKIILPRSGPDEFLASAIQALPGDLRRRHKLALMLYLRYACGVRLEQIGNAFGHHKGHVLRMLRLAKTVLAEKCIPCPAPRPDVSEAWQNEESISRY